MAVLQAEVLPAPALSPGDLIDPAKPAVEVRVSLAMMRPGERATVCSSDLAPADRRLLRAMGLRPDAEVQMCRHGEPCIVRIMGACACSSRIGISRPLAERVYIRRPGQSDAR